MFVKLIVKSMLGLLNKALVCELIWPDLLEVTDFKCQSAQGNHLLVDKRSLAVVDKVTVAL